ncbi:MAG: hypothetical protein ACK5PB_10900 [Pirellula sp.]|jgi:hypothetical protein
MRCMMQAITVSFLLSPFAVAQDLPGTASNTIPTPEVAPVVSVPSTYDPPTFYPTTGGQPYSSLTSYMMCHDNCKNFWAGYPAERAARAAKLCQECSHDHCRKGLGWLTGSNSNGCCTSTGTPCDGQACGNTMASNNVPTNRYQHSWASLYRTSDSINHHSTTPTSELMVANRDRNPSKSDGQTSLLVDDQSPTQQRGNQAGYADRSVGRPDQQVVSPYMKQNNKPQAEFSSTGEQQTGLNPSKPMHLQTTLPPSDRRWSR